MSGTNSSTFRSDIPSVISEVDGNLATCMPPEILENIFKFCKFEDLKSCRLVSKQWNNSTKKLWSLTAYIRIQETGRSNDKQMSKYIQFVEEYGSHSGVNFNMILYYPNYNFNTLIRFFTFCGQQINFLILNVNEFPNAISASDILFKYCPNMKSLVFVGREVDVTAIDKLHIPLGYMNNFYVQENKNVTRLAVCPASLIHAKISCMVLFTSYPNLQRLELRGHVTQGHIQTMFTAINNIRKQDPKKLKLNDIHSVVSIVGKMLMVKKIPPTFLQFLLSPTVPIEKLALTLSCVDDITNLKNIMNTHQSTLKALEMDTTGGPFVADLDDFCFVNVQIKSLLCTTLVTLKLPQDLLILTKFIKFFPNLRKLVVHEGRDTLWLLRCPKISEITLESDLEEFNLASLVELELNHYENAEGILKIIRWFPNVQRLTIPLNNETFELICQGLPKLTSLNINASKVDECGITGLDGGQVFRINKAMGNLCKRPDTVPRANITALKQLRSFHMTMDPYFRSPYTLLNFCSVYHGFQKSACPENIFVRVYNVNEGLWTQEPNSKKDYRTLV